MSESEGGLDVQIEVDARVEVKVRVVLGLWNLDFKSSFAPSCNVNAF
jgi:hypothetical protein